MAKVAIYGVVGVLLGTLSCSSEEPQAVGDKKEAVADKEETNTSVQRTGSGEPIRKQDLGGSAEIWVSGKEINERKLLNVDAMIIKVVSFEGRVFPRIIEILIKGSFIEDDEERYGRMRLFVVKETSIQWPLAKAIGADIVDTKIGERFYRKTGYVEKRGRGAEDKDIVFPKKKEDTGLRTQECSGDVEIEGMGSKIGDLSNARMDITCVDELDWQRRVHGKAQIPRYYDRELGWKSTYE